MIAEKIIKANYTIHIENNLFYNIYKSNISYIHTAVKGLRKIERIMVGSLRRGYTFFKDLNRKMVQIVAVNRILNGS